MDIVELHRRTTTEFVARVPTGVPDVWGLRTPCAEWDVRELVNHVVGEDRWTAPLLAGKTIEEVGDAFAGDLLGDDPAAAAEEAAADAMGAVAAAVPESPKVHLSYGDENAEEYVWQLATDHLVHAWDLAAALGGETRLPADLFEAVAGWFAEREEMYRGSGIIGPRPAGEYDEPQDALIAAFGRDPRWTQP